MDHHRGRDFLARAGKLWHSFGMGNKDARRREVKKPKKKKPVVVVQSAYRPVKEPPKQTQ